MGSYNMTCSVSNLTINREDPIYLIPLVPTDLKRNLLGETAELHFPTFYSQPNDLFTPIGLPIECNYDDCFGYSNIQKTKATELLEGLTTYPIEILLNLIGNRNPIYSTDSPIFGQVFSKDQQDVLTSYVKNRNISNLELFDLKEISEKAYTHKNYPNLLIEFGENSFKVNGGPERHPLNVGEVLRYTSVKENIFLGLSEEDQDKIKLVENMTVMLIHKEVYDSLSVYSGDISYDVNFGEEMKKYLLEKSKAEEPIDPKDRLSRMARAVKRPPLIESFLNRNLAAPEMYETQLVSSYEIQCKIVEFFTFIVNLNEVNKMFMPALAGSQLGNSEAQSRLLKVITKVNNK